MSLIILAKFTDLLQLPLQNVRVDASNMYIFLSLDVPNPTCLEIQHLLNSQLT